MFRQRGVATAVLAIIVLIIVVVGGVAAYEVISKPSSSSSTVSTSSTGTAAPSSSASSSSSSVAAAAETCSTTSTTSTTTASFDVVPLVNSFSAMKLQYNLTSSGTGSENLTESYTRVYSSATTDKVDIVAIVAGGENESETAWILQNGTVLAVNVAGENLTGATANEMILGVFAGFAAEVDAANQLPTYTQASYFHSTGTKSVTISGNTFTVTNWAANTLPETISSCPPGTTSTINSYQLSVGEPKGTSTNIVTYFQLGGSSTTSGTTSSYAYVIQLVSFTVAAGL